MTKTLTSLLYITLSTICFLGQSQNSKISNSDINNAPPIVEYANTITASELKEALYILASNEFKGRLPGGQGDKRAKKFLKSFYRSHKIPSPLGKGKYYQNVPLFTYVIKPSRLKVNSKSYSDESLAPLGRPWYGEISDSEIVFAGEGIETETFSSYKDLNVKDKIVLVKESGDWSRKKIELLNRKANLAKSKGAKLVLVYNQDYFTKNARTIKESKHRINDPETRSVVKEYKFSDNKEAAGFVINKAIAQSILPTIETSNVPQTIKASFSFKRKELGEPKKLKTHNVIAFIEGSEKPEEVIVMTAHLDHLGITLDGDINNGADDNGSGNVALLEIAEAFKNAVDNGYRPKRSIAFLHVTAEEIGLLGSAYYTDEDPIFPLENTVVNLNIDMLGRIDNKHQGNGNYIYLVDSDSHSKELHELSIEANRKYTNLELDFSKKGLSGRTDSYNFEKKNIPVIFFFAGFHEDYHKISDTPEKIAYDALESRTRLVFYIAWELANREERIKLDNP